jgi:hypothetical protein
MGQPSILRFTAPVVSETALLLPVFESLFDMQPVTEPNPEMHTKQRSNEK